MKKGKLTLEVNVQLKLSSRKDGGHGAGGATHVTAHLVHVGRRFQRNTASVESHTFA